mmetsp:Transcript_92/g.213  ORF Transcript_92/g.213 Transcript_92/m.213 type:complete len:224 (-) Transcript_92:315-986(-)
MLDGTSNRHVPIRLASVNHHSNQSNKRNTKQNDQRLGWCGIRRNETDIGNFIRCIVHDRIRRLRCQTVRSSESLQTFANLLLLGAHTTLRSTAIVLAFAAVSTDHALPVPTLDLLQWLLIMFRLVQMRMSFNVPTCGTFRCRTTNLLFWFVGILIHTYPIHLVGWLVFHHIAESPRQTAYVLPVLGIAIVMIMRFAVAVGWAVFWEAPLCGYGRVHEDVTWFR